VIRVLLFLLCSGAAVLAVLGTIENISAARLVRGATQLERSPEDSRFDPGQMLTAAKEAGVLGSCRSDLLRAGLTLYLASLDRISVDTDFDAWSRANRETREFLVHAMECVPWDGNMWLRDTMLSAATVEDEASFGAGLDRSIELAPAEGLLAMARLDFLLHLQPATRASLVDRASADLLNILSAGTDAHLTYVLERMPVEWGGICAAALLKLDNTQRKRVDHMWSVMTGKRESPEAFRCSAPA
jgi:hypothetical protein